MGAAAIKQGPAERVPRMLLGLPARLAWGEALSFPASWILDLPRAVELVLHVPGIPGVVRAGRSRAVLDAARAAGEIAFDAVEWRALVAGAQADRVWALDFRGFCEPKRGEPEWSLSEADALAGA